MFAVILVGGGTGFCNFPGQINDCFERAAASELSHIGQGLERLGTVSWRSCAVLCGDRTWGGASISVISMNQRLLSLVPVHLGYTVRESKRCSSWKCPVTHTEGLLGP